ncbi:U-box domain-containing protein 43-like [Rutidosis leptorrhynchoides]|uniref:U-box domain-containing protein 43-like n=1 Tax=Rutidosis leptorrhynchoides TaxID=125765 RepID=UPI003A99C138
MAEILPIGTILAVAINQVIKTAHAANDVVIEKESFKTLSSHLFDIVRVLKELELKKLNESPIARKALENLETDVKNANTLIDKYKNRSRFYLLIKCRHIVKEVQDVTRDIGKSLNTLSLANTEVLSGISDQVTRLQNEMQRAEFAICQSQLQILDKLDEGLASQKFNQGFANDLIEDIARAVGVNVDPTEIKRELDSFKREKEEAENRKERAEVYFLEQVIELLSRADAARDYEELKDQYMQRLRVVERNGSREEFIQPFKAFICGITKTVMIDPVSLSNGTAYSRVAIEDWFGSGEKTDPVTGEYLDDLDFRPNIQLRQSIQEWKELNYCMKIRSCKAKLLSGNDLSVNDALCQIRELLKENSINKDWVSFGGVTESLVKILPKLLDQEVKVEALDTLKDAVEGHARNKDLVVEQKGFCHIVPFLGCEYGLSKASLELILELVLEESGQTMDTIGELSKQCNPVSFLVTILKSSEVDLVEKAQNVLRKLIDVDEKNAIRAATDKWFGPVVEYVVHGSKSTKMAMLSGIDNLTLDEHDTKLLCELGLIPPLLKMASEDLETKKLSLSVLVKLIKTSDDKRLFAAAGAVVHIMNLICSPPLQVLILAKCFEILEKLSSDGDGIKFLVDSSGTQINLELLVENLLALLKNSLLPYTVIRPVLRALFKICESEYALVKAAVVTAGGVSLVLNLLDHSDSETREAAIKLLFLFSNHEPEGVAEFLLKPRRLEAFICLLENSNKSDVQKAAVGLLANLPKSEVVLTRKLIELEGLKAIINVLETGNMEAKENAMSALFRFTDPTNIEAQKIVVELGTYDLLVDFLKNGSVTAKARAAALIGDLSMRSSELTMTSSPGRWCSCFGQTRVKICPAHGGICRVGSTFCLLEAKALPELVKLLHDEVHATTYEAIQTLSTLVQKESPRRGAHVLHESDAILPILEVLNWGSEALKVEALEVLEKVFTLTEMVDMYGPTARVPLVKLTGGSIHEDGHLHRKAVKVLLLIERHSRRSSSLVMAFNG